MHYELEKQGLSSKLAEENNKDQNRNKQNSDQKSYKKSMKLRA